MKIEVMEGIEQIREIRDDWNAIVDENAGGILGVDLSAAFEWIEALCETHIADSVLRTVVLKDGGEIVGLLPVYQAVVPFAQIKANLLTPVNEVFATRYGFLVRRMTPQYLQEMLSFALREFDGWDLFRVRLVAESEPVKVFRKAVSGLGLNARLLNRSNHPYFALPKQWDEYYSRLKKFRRDLERQERRLREFGNLEYKTYEHPEQVQEFIDAMLDIEQRSWKNKIGTSMKADSIETKFWRSYTPAAAQKGHFLGHLLTLDGVPIAHWFGFVFHNVFSPHKTSYVDRYSSTGPGQILLRMILQELCRREVSMVDFLGEAYDYIMRWTSSQYADETYVIHAKSLRGVFLNSRLSLRNVLNPRGSGTAVVK
jgi:CelD/BcsL family acetyltransferase involved in cellulose biosynthesis